MSEVYNLEANSLVLAMQCRLEYATHSNSDTDMLNASHEGKKPNFVTSVALSYNSLSLWKFVLSVKK